MFVQMMSTLARLQDSKTGLWRQLPLHVKDKDNFLESSCTAMFGYAAAKGTRLGILPSGFSISARNAYEGIVKHCLVGLDTPELALSRICAGTCIGDKDYYYARSQVSSGETYAIGAVLMLANEINNLKQ
jgi:unsaturated rhamnogalacturonyl hydrolase